MKTVANPYWGPKILGHLAMLRNEWGRREYRKWARYATKTLTPYIEYR